MRRKVYQSIIYAKFWLNVEFIELSYGFFHIFVCCILKLTDYVV